jgi:hypothetical protein
VSGDLSGVQIFAKISSERVPEAGKSLKLELEKDRVLVLSSISLRIRVGLV